MPVVYDGHHIQPGPLFQINKEIVRTEEGRIKRKFYTIVARGQLVAFAGSPRSDGSWYTGGATSRPPNETIATNSRMDALKNKQASLIKVFNTQNRLLEIMPWNGQAPIKANVWVKSIDFAEGKWFDVVPYTITMEATKVWWGDNDPDEGGDSLEPEESWSLEVEAGDNRSFRVTHQISSSQKEEFDEAGISLRRGWEVAKSVVDPRLGATAPAGMFPPGTYHASNYLKSVSIDEAGGKYSVQETYTYVWNQRYKEEVSIQIRTNDGQVRVSVEGSVTGFADVNLNDSPDQQAEKKYNEAKVGLAVVKAQAFSRAQSYSGVTLNPTVLTSSEGHQPKTGVINYSFEWDNRPTSLIPGALSETLVVQDQYPTDVFASLVVLGRAAGPILQSIGTRTAAQRTLNIEAVMPPATMTFPGSTRPNVDDIISQYYPGGTCYITRNDIGWDPRKGRFTRTVAWTIG